MRFNLSSEAHEHKLQTAFLANIMMSIEIKLFTWAYKYNLTNDSGLDYWKQKQGD